MCGRLRLVDFVTVGQVLVITDLVLWDGNPVDGALVIVIEEPSWDRRSDNGGCDAEDDTRVQVIASLVNVWVILHENGRVESKLGLDG